MSDEAPPGLTPSHPREPPPMSGHSRLARLSFAEIVDTVDRSILAVQTRAEGPSGSLPLTDEMLRDWPSGDLFGLSQNAGMGREARGVDKDPYLILSTQGGLRGEDGKPVALGYHTGHWEVGLLVRA